jgi:hypothetical protein
MSSDRYAEAKGRAEAVFGPISIEQIERTANDADPRQRLLALALMRRQIERGDDPQFFLSTATKLVSDADNDCRWQALIVVGESIAANPHAVWEVIRQHAYSDDEDMRTGVATVLLEHLLEEHFDDYFPNVREEALRRSANFLETLEMCWFDGRGGPRYNRVKNLLRTAARGCV